MMSIPVVNSASTNNLILVPPDLSSHEIVLAIDHILDQIFKSLEVPSLLNCRLVSHRWLSFAKSHLQEKLTLKFFDQEFHSVFHGTTEFRIRQQKQSQRATKTTISDLNNLLHNGYYFQFPCQEFYFEDISLADANLQAFLNNQGPIIRQLSVSTYTEDKTHEDAYMEQFFKLFLVQAKQLQRVFFAINPSVSPWQRQGSGNDGNEGQPFRPENSPLQRSDPEFQEIIKKVENLPKNPSLRILDLFGENYVKILEFLIQLSPNLQEIILDNRDYKFLLEPVNRMHLLKKLKLTFHPSFDFVTEEKIARSSSLKLEALAISIRNLKDWTPCLEIRVSEIINQILWGSWDSLSIIELSSFTFLRGMKFPDILPKVSKLKIVGSTDFSLENDEQSLVFPRDFDVAKIFPNLRWVKLWNYAEFELMDSFKGFLKGLNFDPVLSVKTVATLGYSLNQESEEVPVEISEMIHKLFPRASVHVDK